MSAYIPKKGMHFYVFCKPRQRVIQGNAFEAESVITQTDGSYRGDVFQCVGIDSCYVAGIVAHGGYGSTAAKLFSIADVKFEPVGPEIMAALGIEVSET